MIPTAPKDCRSETLSCAAGEVCLANDDGRYLCQPESFPDIDGSLVLDATTESDGGLADSSVESDQGNDRVDVGIDAANEPRCDDAIQNGSEEDVDCGGDCPPCADIDECLTDNGGCGDATFFSCTNNGGGCADLCRDIG